ncbi:MAG TPA: hypothetical protein VKM55_08225 [Candidatus Lokiarchaeia archaeon]|nr:hypothetical protein [Candidatus Lokiarchaeia archaeon]
MDVDVQYKKKQFHIEFTNLDVLRVGFSLDRVIDFPYNTEKITCIDWMYGLAESLNKGYPVIDQYDNKSIQLPPYDEIINSFLKRCKWTFRITVGDANEKFSLWLKPIEYIYGLALYETKQAPSWQMLESFKLFSGGINMHDVVTMTFRESPNENKIKTAGPKLARN